jgi:GTPase SAR1 family protein
MSSHPSNSLVKVFRLMILGSPEAGKTCLCSMFTSHIFFEVYEHTESPQFYMKSVRSDTVPTFDASEDLMELENDEDDLFQKYSGNEKESEKKSRSIRDGKNKKKDSSSQARKSNKSKNKLKKYGVQLVDIPGEIHQQLLPGTKEYTAVESPHMPIHSSSSDETTALLQSGRNKNQRSVEKNRLHDDTEPHAFIVLFDATDKQNSLEKAINIVNRIRKRKDPELRDEPIIFLGNKMDRFPRSKDAKNKVRENSKKLAPLMMKIKENRKSKGGSRKMKGGNDIYYGSVLRNEIWADSKEDEVMTVDQLIHKLVIRCNSSGLGSKGVAYEKRQKKFNEQQAQRTFLVFV